MCIRARAYADCIAEGLTDDDLGMLPIYIGVDGEEQQGLSLIHI